MESEYQFRIAFGIFWLANFTVRIYFQLKAKSARKVSGKHEQRARLFFRLLALTYLFMMFYFLSPWFDFAHVDLPLWIREYVGGGALAVYLILFSWSHAALGKNWSGFVEIHENHALVTSGPYRCIRHPMYSAFFVSVIGFSLLSANWLIALVYLTAVTAMYADRVDAEEQLMVEQFGDVYREYMTKTWRLFPKI
jgi:protein-S-isoprenylcysteine O-methyltransferase Ste14